MVELATPLIVIRMLWFKNLTTCREMFLNIGNIIWIDLSKFDSSLIKSTYLMFYGCNSLLSINLSNFNTSLVTDMGQMFYNCPSLVSLNLSNFNTSLVTNMGSMFSYCSSLVALDLTNFNTSLVTNMGSMFSHCTSLVALDLTNFNTSLVTNMGSMFSQCTSLVALDLSNFNTSLVTNNCRSLNSLNLSNFEILNVEYFEEIFQRCYNLEYINFGKMKESNLSESYISYDIFNDVPENIVYCINETNAPYISSFLQKKICSINYCQENWKKKQKKMYLINGKYECEEQTELTSDLTIINDDSSYAEEEYSYKSEYEEQTELIDEEINISDNTNNCQIEIKHINEELSFNTIERYINEYLNNNSNIKINLLTKHYINENINLSITIFNFWFCTNLLLEYGYYEINTSKILFIMNKSTKITNNTNYIFLYINYNYKSYTEINIFILSVLKSMI